METKLFGCLPQSLFQSLDKSQSLFGLSEESLPPAPPPVEVLLSEGVQLEKYVAEVVNLHGGLVMFKGRVNTSDVFGVSNSDLVPGKYEGGLKLWESSIDLVNTLKREIQDGQLSFRGKQVLELGCGHGLPGIFACLKGALTIHFQDFNAEVLRCLTIPNVNANLEQTNEKLPRHADGAVASTTANSIAPDIHFYAGDWGELHSLLSMVATDQVDSLEEADQCLPENGLPLGNFPYQDTSTNNQETPTSFPQVKDAECGRKHSRSPACERARDRDISEGGYDIILTAETIYSIGSMQKLYQLIKKCLRPPYGVVYLAAKRHYFGVGGGTRQFKSLVEADGILGAHLVVDISDGASNVREIWKFFFK